MSQYKSVWILLSLIILGCGNREHSVATSTDEIEIADTTFVTFDTYTPSNRQSPTQSEQPTAGNVLQEMNNRIGLEGIARELSNSNFVISPPGMLMITGLTYAGSTDAAVLSPATSVVTTPPSQLPDAFNAWRQTFNTSNSAYRFNTRIWGQSNYQFLRNYLDSATEKFGATLEPAAFQKFGWDVGSQLHSWLTTLELNESAIAASVLDGIDTTTRVVYGNAFQLDAKFDSASVPTEIINGLFEKPDGKQIRIPMLHRIDTLLYYESDFYKAAELALSSDTVSVLVVVPKQNEFSLVEQSITSVIANFDQSAHLQKLDFTLPLFEVDSTSRNYAAISSANSEILNSFFKTCDADGNCTTHSAWPNYENINGLGYLELGDSEVTTLLKLDAIGISASSVAMCELRATLDEPSGLISGGLSMGGGTIGLGISTCNLVYQQAGPTQARAFIFVVRDQKTKTVLFTGHMHAFDGQYAGSEVCSQDLITYAEAIWPVVPEVAP